MTVRRDEPRGSPADAPDTTQLSIFVRSCDRYGGRALYAEIADRARAAGLPGASVFLGMQGFGGSGTMHSPGWAGIGDGLPVMIQVVGATARVAAFLPMLDPLIGSGLVIVSPVFAKRLRARAPRREPGEGTYPVGRTG
jgi:uncharacterized protein